MTDGLPLSNRQQSPAQQAQVGQAHQHVHLDGILHQPAVAGHGVSKSYQKSSQLSQARDLFNVSLNDVISL